MRALIPVIFLVGLLPVTLCAAQDDAMNTAFIAPAPIDPQFATQRPHQSPGGARMEREMAKARNKDRQRKIQQDTDKLLKLATELKQYVDKSNEEILSIEVLKKTDEIEKLAKSVHDKMKAGNYEVGLQ